MRFFILCKNKLVQIFGLFVKFGILTFIFSIQFLSLLSLKVSEYKDTQSKNTHTFFLVRFHVSALFYKSKIYIIFSISKLVSVKIYCFVKYSLFQYYYYIKRYLCYQTTTNEAQIKNFFISYKSYVPFSRYSSFCIFNHTMIYQICDVTMSIST